GDVALADAGAAADPLVRRFHLRGEVGVGDDPGRQVAPGAGDARERHAGALSGRSLLVMRAITSFCASSSARSSARRNAKASAEPWLFTTMPRRPSSVAPL